MKHLEYFRLFESKTHNLVLPKNNEELEKLESMPSFQNIKSLGLRNSRGDGKDIRILRNGSIEIAPSDRYEFIISKDGTFYYGSYKVGPQYVELDTWDKVFDYVYIYYIANTRILNMRSSPLENFVFKAIISAPTYNSIKESDYYQKILELSRKYNGSLTDEALSKIMGEASKYISDPLAVLETPSYKFFDKIFDFEYVIGSDPNSFGNGPHDLKVTFKNATPFGMFDDDDELKNFIRASFSIGLEGSKRQKSAVTRVKTIKGLDKSVFNRIKELANQKLGSWFKDRMDPSSVMKFELSFEIFRNIVKDYEEGRTGYTKKMVEDILVPILRDKIKSGLDFKRIDRIKKVFPGTYEVLKKEFKNLDTASSLGDLGF